ncbi:MAG: helix-turn-helix domain-containing protein [Acidimicrobiales bacterium]
MAEDFSGSSAGRDRRGELGGFIRERRSESRLSLRRLSALAGVSNPYLSQIERGLRKPSAEILQRLAKALQISAESLYERAGILERGADLTGHIRRDPVLSDEQKDQLIRLYESFSEQPESPAADPEEGSPATGR